MTLSRTAPKCSGCPLYGKCDKKQMEALACKDYLMAERVTVDSGIGADQPVLRSDVKINLPHIEFDYDISREVREIYLQSSFLDYGA